MTICSSLFTENKIKEICWSTSNNWSFNTKNSTWNHICKHTSFWIRIWWNFIFKILLISRFAKFVFWVKIYPKLETQAWSIKTIWHFCMNDSFTSCHPLNISRSNFTLMTFKVFMPNFSTQHVSDSLKTSMRMVWKTCW